MKESTKVQTERQKAWAHALSYIDEVCPPSYLEAVKAEAKKQFAQRETLGSSVIDGIIERLRDPVAYQRRMDRMWIP